jgi:hypothetical protein
MVMMPGGSKNVGNCLSDKQILKKEVKESLIRTVSSYIRVVKDLRLS